MLMRQEAVMPKCCRGEVPGTRFQDNKACENNMQAPKSMNQQIGLLQHADSKQGQLISRLQHDDPDD